MLNRWTGPVAAAVAGWCAMALPVLLVAHPPRGAAFLPMMADVADGISLVSLACLVLVCVWLGATAPTRSWVLGLVSVAAFPLWSAIDLAMGGAHPLLPLEWMVYGFYAAVATTGAAIGRFMNRRFGTAESTAEGGDDGPPLAVAAGAQDSPAHRH